MRPKPLTRTSLRGELEDLAPFLLLVTVLALAGLCRGAVAGTISGKVTETPGSAALPGVSIVVVGTSLGASSSVDGTYRIEGVPEGIHQVKISAVGYRPVERAADLRHGRPAVTIDAALTQEAVQLAEVVVTARADMELESSARRSEKSAENVINVISSQAIEKSTDRTAADALQRVSGMSLVRDSQGEGRYVIMRGLEQRYNNTLVDGIKIPSPESKDRFVPMDIFPAALFQRLEVSKALTPETAGDAIGGSTNLILRDAPERFVLRVSAGAGYNGGLLTEKLTTFDREAISRLDPDRLHGTVSDQNPTRLLAPRYRARQSDFTVDNLKFTDGQAPPDLNLAVVTGNRFLGQKLGVMASACYQNTYGRSQTDVYQIDEDLNSLDQNGFSIPYLSTYQHRIYSSNKTRTGATVKGDCILGLDHQLTVAYLFLDQQEAQTRYTYASDLRNPGGVSNYEPSYRSALRHQRVSNLTAMGTHFSRSPITLQWTANYTDATQDRPDEAELNLKVSHNFRGDTITGLHYLTHSWRKNDDKQYLAKVDATCKVTPNGTHTLRAGAVVQHLSRVNFQNDYYLNPAILSTGQTGVFTTIDSAKVTPIGVGGNPAFGFQNYNADETVVGGYLQYTLAVGPLQILAGARVEHADDRYFTMAPITAGRNEAKIRTTDLLPGIHFRYEFSPRRIGRLSATRSMSRPSYFDLVPAQDRQDNSSTTGNPDLRAPHSTNLDLRYEFYPNSTEQLSLGVYAKRITDPIEDSFRPGGVNVNTKTNGKPAVVYGAEMVAVKRFGPFGLTANYSYAYSRETAEKYLHRLDAAGNNVATTFEQRRPLQSQSDHVANVVASYERQDWGTQANLSYNYTGRRLQAVNAFDGYDIYQRPVGYLDLSVEQQAMTGVKISVKVKNILNSVSEVEVPTGQYVKHDTFTIQRDVTNVRGTLGLAYAF